MANRVISRTTKGYNSTITDELNIDNEGVKDIIWNDQHTEIINLHFTRLIQPIAIAADTNIDDTSVSITAASAPVVGNLVCFKEYTAFYQGYILSVAGTGPYTVTLDTPLDFAFTTAGGCSERSEDMNVDGSVTPVEFSVSPANLADGVEWDITRIIGTMLDNTSMDDGKFGGGTALTKGIVLRYSDGITKNIFNAKTNGDLAEQMYDVQYATNSPAGLYGLRFRRSFAGLDKNGVVIRLDAARGDTLSIIIQDNLTGLVEFHCVVQGHRTDSKIEPQ